MKPKTTGGNKRIVLTQDFEETNLTLEFEERIFNARIATSFEASNKEAVARCLEEVGHMLKASAKLEKKQKTFCDVVV